MLARMLLGEITEVYDDYGKVAGTSLLKHANRVQQFADRGNANFGKTVEYIIKRTHLDVLVECEKAGGEKNV